MWGHRANGGRAGLKPAPTDDKRKDLQMLKLDDVVIALDSGDSEELADFYERLLGW
jgi:hypothetical protein